MKPFSGSMGWAVGLLLWGGWATATPLLAQVRPDRTLSQPSSIRATRVNDRPTTLVEGGTRRSGNLFHSFSSFNVRAGQRLYFANPAGVERIFSRVTGNQPSLIRGRLGVAGAADLFLVNPHGILFGSQARLDIRGSFLATTAEGIRFPNGFHFSAIQPETPPLLTVSLPVGLQFGPHSSSLINRSIAESHQSVVGLQVASGQTLALVGGDLNLAGGKLTAPGGRIELGSVGERAQVSLHRLNRGWRLGYEQVQDFGEISLLGQADVDVSGAGGGAIRLRGEQIQVTEGSLIRSNTLGNRAGQDIVIQAERLVVQGVTLIDGELRVSLISTSTFGAGNGGDVELHLDQLTVAEGGQIEVNANAAGRGGNLTVHANSIELRDVARFTNGQLILDADGRPPRLPFGSGLFVRINQGATPTGISRSSGNLFLTTQRLQVEDGAQIVVETGGNRAAGRLDIEAADLKLSGVTLQANGEPYTIDVGRGASTFPSLLSTFTGSNRRGGRLQIVTERLQLRAGAVIQTATQNSGNAGNLEIRARSIDIAGANGTPSALLTSSGGVPEVRVGNPEATGRAGSMTITTESLTLEDRGILAASSLNPSGDAAGTGNIQIQAETISLDNQARLTTSSASIDGGNIQLQVRDALRLQRNSDISASAGFEGRGGNIKIQADNGFLIASTQQDNDITATAEQGRGGNITIAAGIFGIEQRRATPGNGTNDIDASSRSGISGTVTLTEPNVDPTRGVTELAAAPASPEPVQGCQVNPQQARAAFFNTGRGGIPPSPDEALNGDDILVDLRNPTHTAIAASGPPAVNPSPAPNSVVEANSWALNQQGQFVLVARAPVNLQGCRLR